MLTWNAATGEYVVFSNDKKRAEDVGMTLSTKARGPNGELVYFTKENYAALAYWRDADAKARNKLGNIYDDYAMSWADDWYEKFPVGQEGTIQRITGTRPYQDAAVAYALKRQHTLLGDEMGIGKSKNSYEPVLTPIGWKTIGSLRVGDDVISQDGSWCKVVGVYPQGKRAMVRFHFRDGTYADSDYDHLWAVRNGNHRARGGHWRVKSSADIAKVYSGKGPSVNCRYEIPVMEPAQFAPKKFIVDPYILGTLLGDGSLTGCTTTVTVGSLARDIVDIIASRLAEPMSVSKGIDASGCSNYNLVSAEVGYNLYTRELGRLGVRIHSEDKFIPEEYKWGSVQQRLDLLRGLMDTDGSSGGNRISFHTTSKRLSEDVAYLVRSLGGIAIYNPYDRSAEGKPTEHRVNVKMNICPFYTKRKAANWSPPERGNRVCKFITSVEELPGEHEAVCIAVDHPSHLYVVHDFIVTHNTCSSIAFANALGAEKILVICPASIRLNWRRQVKLWSTIPKVRAYPILKGKDGVASWSNYTIISYELARNEGIHAALRAVKWDLLIIDEAHFLKSYDALRTRAIFGGGRNLELKQSLAECAKRVIALTGTPIPNRPRECYMLAKALCPESIDWMTPDEFAYRFNPSARMGNGHIEEAKGRLPELHARLRCNFMIRRLKKDVMKYLPEKQYEFTYIEPNGDIKEALRHERMLDFDPARDLSNPGTWDKIDGEVSTVRREMGEAKIPRIVEHMKYLLDVEEIEKVVLFCHHRSVMDAMVDALAHYGVVQVRGGMGSTAKDNSIQRFQNDPDTRVFIGQLDAAGFGIDGLQNVASRVVFGEPAWVPGANDQAVDRLHRDGQKFPVLAQFLIVEGSFDERVLGSVLDKVYTINETLDKQETRRAA